MRRWNLDGVEVRGSRWQPGPRLRPRRGSTRDETPHDIQRNSCQEVQRVESRRPWIFNILWPEMEDGREDKRVGASMDAFLRPRQDMAATKTT